MRDLTDRMSPSTYRACGMHKLTDVEVESLTAWIEAETDAAVGGAPRLGVLSAVMPGGRAVELDDGSLWRIDDGDAATVDTWQPGANILIAGFHIARIDDADTVGATCVSQGDASGVAGAGESRAPSGRPWWEQFRPDETPEDDFDATLSTGDAVAEIMAAMPSQLNRAAVAGQSFTIQFHLTGDGGGDWHLEVADGQPRVCQGAHAAPSMTMTLSARDYVDLIAGRMNGQRAFLEGRLKISGELGLAARMQDLFREP